MQINHLSKSFGKKKLFQDLSFSFDKGILLIDGESGCGKTTLLEILMGNVSADSGEVDLQEEGFSYCGQKASLFLNESMKKNLLLFADTTIEDPLYLSYCKALDFSFPTDKTLSKASGGERAKAEIIIALLKDMPILFMDEPFSSLDKKSKLSLASLLNDYAKSHTILLVNHDKEIVKELVINKTISFSKTTGVQIEEGVDCEKKEVVYRSYVPSEKRVLFAALSAIIKNNLFDYVLKFLLVVFSLFSFSFAVSLTNTNTELQNIGIGLDNDPFLYHQVTTESKDSLTPSFYDDRQTYQTLEMPVYSSSSSYLLVATDKIQDDHFYLYTPETFKSPLLLQENQEAYFEGDDNRYPVTLLDQEDNLLKEHLQWLSIQSIYDGYDLNKALLFTSWSLFDKTLLYGQENLIFSSYQVACFEPLKGLKNYGYYLEVTTNESQIVVTDEEGYQLRIFALLAGQKIKINSLDMTLTTTGSTKEESVIEMSLPLYKDFLFHLFSNEMKKDDMFFSIYLDRSSILSYYEQENLQIHDFIQFKAVPYANNILYAISLALFVLLLLYGLITRDVSKRQFSKIQSVICHNGLKRRTFTFNRLLYSLSFIVFSLPLSFILYYSCFIPLANLIEKNFMYPTGYAFIGEPYFTDIKGALPFYSPLNIIFFLFALTFLFGVALFLVGKQKKKD